MLPSSLSIYAVDRVSYAGGLAFRDNAHQVDLDKFELVSGKFFYEYNFLNIVDIRVESIQEETTMIAPFTV